MGDFDPDCRYSNIKKVFENIFDNNNNNNNNNDARRLARGGGVSFYKSNSIPVAIDRALLTISEFRTDTAVILVYYICVYICMNVCTTRICMYLF
jgi:hypothetical protein